MAKQIIWTDRAQKERIAIFSYWNLRNGSNLFSRKLNELIKRNLLIIRDHPEIGQLTDKEKVRVKVVKDYLIFYEAIEVPRAKPKVVRILLKQLKVSPVPLRSRR
jgi:toxin YoeB